MDLSRPERSPVRFALLAASTLLAAWLLPAAAPAQTYPDPNMGTGGTGGSGAGANGLTKADFQVHYQTKVDNTWQEVSPNELEFFFNRARCLCDQPFRVQLNLLSSGIAKARSIRRAEIRLKAGDQTCVCTGAACSTVRCTDIDTPRDINSLLIGGLTFETTVRSVFAGGQSTAAGDLTVCNRDEMQSLWVWMDVADDSAKETVLTDVKFDLRLDGVPPGVPDGLSVSPGNEALQVNWNQLSYLDDLQGYIVFCARNGDIPVFSASTRPTPSYSATVSLCPDSAASAASPPAGEDLDQALAADGTGAIHGPAPEKIRQLDPQFACSNIITGGGGVRLYQLQNGIPYVVGVASVDKRGNASPIEDVVLQAPIPTRDFYRSYREAGGSAEGGFCALAPRSATPGPGPLLLVAAALMGLFIRRRPR